MARHCPTLPHSDSSSARFWILCSSSAGSGESYSEFVVTFGADRNSWAARAGNTFPACPRRPSPQSGQSFLAGGKTESPEAEMVGIQAVLPASGKFAEFRCPNPKLRWATTHLFDPGDAERAALDNQAAQPVQIASTTVRIRTRPESSLKLT